METLRTLKLITALCFVQTGNTENFKLLIALSKPETLRTVKLLIALCKPANTENCKIDYCFVQNGNTENCKTADEFV